MRTGRHRGVIGARSIAVAGHDTGHADADGPDAAFAPGQVRLDANGVSHVTRDLEMIREQGK